MDTPYVMVLLYSHLVRYPTTMGIGILWNTGITLGSCTSTQLATGMLLGLHYTPGIHTAYYSVIHLTREVYYGSMYRLYHTTLVSLVFLVLQVHTSGYPIYLVSVVKS
jgi:ubiquinol-cytochrome c reductase cytochrome b subunit